MLHRVLHFAPDDGGGDGGGEGGEAGAAAAGTLAEDRGEGHAAGDVVGETGGGVRVKKSGVEKGAIGVKGAGAQFLAALEKGDAKAQAIAGGLGKDDGGDDGETAEEREDRLAEEEDARKERAAAGETDEEREEREADEKAEKEKAALDRRERRRKETEAANETAEQKTAREAVEAAEAELAEHETEDETKARHAKETADGKREKKKTEEGATGVVKITLPGESDRGEEDIEVDIEDPEIAERIKRALNSGMRRKAADEFNAKVAQREAVLKATMKAIESDPVAYTLNHMSPVRQQEVAKALFLEHGETLVPLIQEWMDDDAARQRARVDLRDQMHKSENTLRTQTDIEQRTVAVFTKIGELLPDDIDDRTRERFLRDADADLSAAVRAGEQVTPDRVADLLKDRLELYGIEAGSTSSTSRTRGSRGSESQGAAGTARPLSAKAKELAEKKLEEARAAQERLKRVSRSRRAAGRVAPAGAGAGAVSKPVVPTTADVKEASKALRKSGALSKGWPVA